VLISSRVAVGTPRVSPKWYHLELMCRSWMSRLSRLRVLSVEEEWRVEVEHMQLIGGIGVGDSGSDLLEPSPFKQSLEDINKAKIIVSLQSYLIHC